MNVENMLPHPPDEPDGDASEGRQGSDRRRRPTPMFSRYTLFGRRRRNRRDTDPSHRYYVDWIDGHYRRALIAVVLFILFDSFSTLHIISKGGGEANPLMAMLLGLGAGWFVAIKIISALWAFILLAVHRFFPVARLLSAVLLAAYGMIVIYHLYLLLQIHG
jgi:hypothetical protein